MGCAGLTGAAGEAGRRCFGWFWLREMLRMSLNPFCNSSAQPGCAGSVHGHGTLAVPPSVSLQSTIAVLRGELGKARLVRERVVGKNRVLSRGAGGAAGVREARRILIQRHGQVQVLLRGTDPGVGSGGDWAAPREHLRATSATSPTWLEVMATILSRSSTSCLKVGLWEGTACQQSRIIMYLPGMGARGAQPWAPHPGAESSRNVSLCPGWHPGPVKGIALQGLRVIPCGRKGNPPACPHDQRILGRRMGTVWAAPRAGDSLLSREMLIIQI